MWLQSQLIITKGKAYTRFSAFLKHCRVCPLQKQCMRNPPKETGREVQFPDESNLVVSYSDKMKVKIDSPVGRGNSVND